MSDQPKTVLLGFRDLIALGYCRPNGQARGTASTETIPFRRPRHGRTRRRAATTPGMARLRQLTYPYIHGEKTACGVRPSVNKIMFLSMWNGGRITRIPKLANYRLADHAAGEATYYFWSRPDGRYLLFMVDIDVQKSRGLGTPEGGRDFAAWLDRQVIPGCHWEPSTNGQGMHGYGILDLGEGHESVGVHERKEMLRRFEADLRAVARGRGADIELVEVKGHPPVIHNGLHHHGRNIDMISSMTYGTFAKVPRDIEAVAALKPVSLERLKELAAGVPEHPECKRKTGGSCTGKVVTEEMLALLPELEKLGEELLAGRRLLEGRQVTAYDVACVLLLAWVFGQPGNANPGGAMPTRRFQAMWDALYEAGDFKRGWSCNRFKAVRDLLSAEGLIDWIDETYCHGEGGGRACRWRLTAEMATAIDGLAGPGQEGEASSVNSSPPWILQNLPRTGRNLRPVRVRATRRVLIPTKVYLHEYSLAA